MPGTPLSKRRGGRSDLAPVMGSESLPQNGGILIQISQSMGEDRKAVSTSPASSLQPYLVATAKSARTVTCLATGAKVSLKSMPSFMNWPLITTRALYWLGNSCESSMGGPRCLMRNTQSAGVTLTGFMVFWSHSSPKVPFLRWQSFSRFMAAIHLSARGMLTAWCAWRGVAVCIMASLNTMKDVWCCSESGSSTVRGRDARDRSA